MPLLLKKGVLKNEYFEELGNRVNDLEAEGLFKALVRTVDNVSPFFVVSFCRHHTESDEYQNGLLSQWRGYADGGGFAIEFDEKSLDELAKRENESLAYAGVKSDDVSYYDHKEVFKAADYEGAAGEMIRGAIGNLGLDVSDVTGSVNEVVLAYAKAAPFLKHPAFCEEDEYRIVFVCFRASKVEETSKLPAKKIKVRQRDGLLVPYIELFETLSEPLPIKSIIVGPHPYQARQEESLRMFLELEKLNIPVRSSHIPYRI